MDINCYDTNVCGGDCNHCALHPSEVKCPKCGWHGLEDEAAIHHDDDYTEHLCPDCNVNLAFCDDDSDKLLETSPEIRTGLTQSRE